MRLRLTVSVREDTRNNEEPGAPLLHEIEVDAPESTTVTELARALGDHLGVAAPRTMSAHGAVLPDDAVLGRPPLVDGAALTFGPHPTGHPPPGLASRGSPVVLAVTHGPDAGRTIDVVPGRVTLGRSPDADVTIADPLLSRIHLELRADETGVHVRDLGSTNGTRLDGAPIDRVDTALSPGALLRLGDTALVLRTATALPAASTPQPDGTQLVNRGPRVREPARHPTITMPTRPDPPRPARVPWAAALLPALGAVVMATLLGPTMLAFAVMGPLVVIGTVVTDRVGGRRRYAEQLAAYGRLHTAARASVEAACVAEGEARRAALPDPAAVLSTATGSAARLWERRRGDEDALTVSIGECTAPAHLRVVEAHPDRPSEPTLLTGVPCAIPLGALGVMGLCGPRDAVLGAARSVVGQLLTHHSPHDLSLVVLALDERGDDWLWLGRVPHLRQPDGAVRPHRVAVLSRAPALATATVDELIRVMTERRSKRSPGSAWAGPYTVVLIDGAAALRGLPQLATVLESGVDVGIVCLALDTEAAALPSETGVVVDLSDPDRPSAAAPGQVIRDLVVDRVGAWWADRLSRGLAPLRDATPVDGEDALPAQVRLGDLVETPGADAVVELWRGASERTAVPVGVGRSGPWLLDLATDGPHVVVAGTTGSGKSEFLRTLVSSLALHHRPEHLSLVLIDYKGGAAFRECADLPHTAGVVTDLDEHLSRRALVSLRAELKRRESLFRSYGVADFAAYQGDSRDRPPLPRLVIVVDEFRALAEELPEFVDGMVRIAALGRSLGVHLVLATQRPAGVITADIKANVNLRIALRVRDRADSVDVLDAPDAAGIDPTTPGRGCARAGGGALVPFQSAMVGASARAWGPRGIRVRSLGWGEPEGLSATSSELADSAELQRIAAAITAAARAVGAACPPPAWLPPLPERVAIGDLVTPSTTECAIGLLDRPERQEQVPLNVDLTASGHWAFVGTSGSGRTTALMTMAAASAACHPPTELHLYAVSGGSLSGLTALPHCGAHVDLDDLARLDRLVERLGEALLERRRHPTRVHPHLLLLIDDWDLLAPQAGSVDQAIAQEALLGLLREGAGLGLTAALAGDRALLVGRAASLTPHRLLLRLADRTDAALAGLPTAALPVRPSPGRGVLPDGTEVPLAAGNAPPPCVAGSGGGSLPVRLEPLPTQLCLDDLPRAARGDEVTLGLGGDALEPVALSEAADGRRWLVAGPPGSGVSTGLLVITSWALALKRPVAVVSDCAGPLEQVRDHPGVVAWCDRTSAAALDGARARFPRLVVVVDDADGLVDSPIDALLRDLARTLDRTGGLVVVGANSTVLASQYRGVAVEVARHRTGLLLRPGSALDAELLGVRVRRDPRAPVGRGHLVRRGVATPVQVAIPRLHAP
ncbi:FtsK/SpoIIIE domain-containing protein [Nostocoides sp. HKS02]|uniref:FtsK/SpoIIIE domain-containing protein n=1 Tax=Nostocoides sp. HKS02 TaxID=1813880 RepID=UPI0012B489C0|nr:FtsK/SpoIIIE domain-containing protein [Tetrasphaera sp. HKS02]QGN56758.1 FHA domain-containing protein [Tetrasphaera sp. HKS02]